MPGTSCCCSESILPTSWAQRCWRLLAFCVIAGQLVLPKFSFAQPPSVEVPNSFGSYELTDQQSELLEKTVDRGIEYILQSQSPDGSFAAAPIGQPGITSLCCLAILSAGDAPSDSPEGKQLQRAIDFVLSTQQKDGMLSQVKPGQYYSPNNAVHAALYNHAMGGLLLAEAYGMTSSGQNKEIEVAVARALTVTRKYQTENKRRDTDVGGWKYAQRSPHTPADSDLSVTAWQLSFLRSAKNAGFYVPKQYAQDAVEYVERSFDKRNKQFLYGINEPNPYTSRGIVGAGILALKLAGEHHAESARIAADRLIKQSFKYNEVLTPYEHYQYTIYHCSQAMYQMGDAYWSRYFPNLLESLAANQQEDGSWIPSRGWDKYGRPYSAALSILALTPQYQILPIYQR